MVEPDGNSFLCVCVFIIIIIINSWFCIVIYLYCNTVCVIAFYVLYCVVTVTFIILERNDVS